MSISSLVLKLWQFTFIRDLTRNLEFGNTLVWLLPNIWRLGQVGNTKFGTNVSNKILLNAAKCKGYSFYRFWVTKGRSTRGIKLPTLPIQIRVNAWDINVSILFNLLLASTRILLQIYFFISCYLQGFFYYSCCQRKYKSKTCTCYIYWSTNNTCKINNRYSSTCCR